MTKPNRQLKTAKQTGCHRRLAAENTTDKAYTKQERCCSKETEKTDQHTNKTTEMTRETFVTGKQRTKENTETR